jgi:radical SAM superfamily enzyme YgiQ (UPF0313 family)
MGKLRSQTELVEYNINGRAIDIVEDLLNKSPDIIGFGIYIWNTEQTTQVIKLLKEIKPEIKIVLGGPEVSYEYEDQECVKTADYLITGQADQTFRETCEQILKGLSPINKFIQSRPFKLNEINLPYEEYTETDIANRIIYVEASRGCPFKCEFCLSSLDKTVYPFDLDLFLNEMQKLYDKGVKHFKFVDRTFNLKVDTSIRIMEFFLDKQDNELFLHFELIPDHLPEKLKSTIARFPEHSLQFEIGIQSLNPEVQTLISRKQDTEKARNSMHWIRNHSHGHIHADLIIGLPGEDINSFARGFNELYLMEPHEIQVGILKRLRGTPVIRHTEDFDARYSPLAPYNILSNKLIDFKTMQRLTRFARYWDIIINSGRFKHSRTLLLADMPFENFLKLSDWLYRETKQTHQFSLERLFKLLHKGTIESLKLDKTLIEETLLEDFEASGIKGSPKFIINHVQKPLPKKQEAGSRQKRHLQ